MSACITKPWMELVQYDVHEYAVHSYFCHDGRLVKVWRRSRLESRRAPQIEITPRLPQWSRLSSDKPERLLDVNFYRFRK